MKIRSLSAIVRRVTVLAAAPPALTVRQARSDDWVPAGRICYEAFATLADEHGFEHDFPTIAAASEPIRWMIEHPRFYGVVAELDGRVVGSSFLDERGTILGIGPVSVDPRAQNHRVGRALMEAMFERAREHDHAPGVRLLQLAYHNRSLALYAKLGMEVRGSFAAMYGPTRPRRPRPATRSAGRPTHDVAACNALCFAVHGHERAGEVEDAMAAGVARVVRAPGPYHGLHDGRELLRPFGRRDARRPDRA